jgi:hypothetical protein
LKGVGDKFTISLSPYLNTINSPAKRIIEKADMRTVKETQSARELLGNNR